MFACAGYLGTAPSELDRRDGTLDD